jgi:hypothetical protein
MQTERKESYRPITIKYTPILRTCLYVYLRSFKEGMRIFIAGRKSLIEEFPEGRGNLESFRLCLATALLLAMTLHLMCSLTPRSDAQHTCQ